MFGWHIGAGAERRVENAIQVAPWVRHPGQAEGGRSLLTLLSSIFLSALFLPGATAPALAQSVKDAYLLDARGEVVRNTAFGDAKLGNLCWRTGYWTPALAISQCDPDIAPGPAPPPRKPPVPAPAAGAKPAPAKAPVPTAPANVSVSGRKCEFVETLGADETFEFNRATLRPAARARLDAAATRAAGCATVSRIVVTGHTDRLGSAQYNQKLSERRAEAVAGYLKGKGLANVESHGVGKTLPIKACDERQPRAVLVDCLALNRRVEIEVQGMAW